MPEQIDYSALAAQARGESTPAAVDYSKLADQARGGSAPPPTRGFWGTLYDYGAGLLQEAKDYVQQGPPAARGLRYAALSLKRDRGETLSPEEAAQLHWLEQHNVLSQADGSLADNPISGPLVPAATHIAQGDPGAAAADLAVGYGLPAVIGAAAEVAPKIPGAIRAGIAKAAPILEKTVPRVARSVGTGIGAYAGGSTGAILGGEIGDAAGRALVGMFRSGAGDAAMLDGFAKSLAGQKFADLTADQQTAVRGLYDKFKAAEAARAAKSANPTPPPPATPAPPVEPNPNAGKSLTQIADEIIAERKAAAKTARANNGARTPLYNNPEALAQVRANMSADTGEAPIAGPAPRPALPSGRVPGGYTEPAPAPQPAPRTPQWANQQILDRIRAGLPPSQAPAGTPPAPAAPTVESLSNELNAELAKNAPPPAEPKPPVDYKANARAAKADAIADYLHRSGVPADKVAQLVGQPTAGKGNFWEAAAQGAGQNVPSAETQPLILDRLRALEARNAPAAPAPAPEPAAAPAPAKPAPPASGANFEDARALAQALHHGGQGITAEQAGLMSSDAWRTAAKQLGLPKPSVATIQQARFELGRLDRAAPYARGLADALGTEDMPPPGSSASVRGPVEVQRMSRPAESGSPPTGPHGPIFTDFRGDAAGAVRKLQEIENGEAPGALFHPAIGDIDLIWGKAGNPAKDFKNGFGLAHILAKHEEMRPQIENLGNIVKDLPVAAIERGGQEVRLENGRYRAIVSRVWQPKGQGPKPKNWLLTAFEPK